MPSTSGAPRIGQSKASPPVYRGSKPTTFRDAISGPPQKTPFYIAAPGKPSAPMSESSSARRKAAGLPPEIHGDPVDNLRKIAARATAAIADSTPARSAVTTTSPTAASTTSWKGGGGSLTPTATAPTPTTSSTPTVAPTPAPEPTPTTSGGTAGSSNNVPASESRGGKGQSSGRVAATTNRRNPRQAKSTTIDELKKQAARQLGI